MTDEKVIPMRHHVLEAERARVVAALHRVADAFETATIERVADVLLRANAAVAILEEQGRRLAPGR